MEEKRGDWKKMKATDVASASVVVHKHVSFPRGGTCVYEDSKASRTKGKAKKQVLSSDSDSDSEELDRPSRVALPCIFKEGKGSQNKDKEEGLSDKPSHMGMGMAGGTCMLEDGKGSENKDLTSAANMYSPPRVAEDEGGELSRSSPKAYSCTFCDRLFHSAQALGGHQNTHKAERENAKRQRLREQMPVNHSSADSAPASYFYGRLPYDLSLAPPQLPFWNANNFNLPRPPPAYPYFMPGFPYPPSGQFGPTPNHMLFNSGQLPLYDRHRMIINPNGSENRNYLGIMGGGVYGNTSSAFNSFEGAESSGGLPSLNGNNHVSSDGFDSAGTTSSGMIDFLGLYQGESNCNAGDEVGGDGTRDFLSLVGAGIGTDNDGDGTRGHWVTDHNANGSSSSGAN